jgi:hypothetical protein
LGTGVKGVIGFAFDFRSPIFSVPEWLLQRGKIIWNVLFNQDGYRNVKVVFAGGIGVNQ